MDDRNPYAPPASQVADPTTVGPKPILIGIWLTTRIRAGRSWARILVCVILAVSTGYLGGERSALFFLFQGKVSMALIRSSQFAKLLLSIITITLLFTPPANRWFRWSAART